MGGGRGPPAANPRGGSKPEPEGLHAAPDCLRYLTPGSTGIPAREMLVERSDCKVLDKCYPCGSAQSGATGGPMYKYGLLLLSGACLFCVEKSALAVDVLEAARRKHETPVENVRKSQRYDYLLSTDARFRRHRSPPWPCLGSPGER
jgi:hypothetical protein